MRTTTRSLKEIINKRGVARIMASHNPLSAILAEEAGFDGLWASGFELSASLGLADVSLVSMVEHLAVVRTIAERTDLPVVADIDTGFGNAINVLHAVKQYEAAGGAAVVIEDKCFPKMTSLMAGGRQELLRVEEFQGKINAAVHARSDPEFMVIARTEALIAGFGIDVALERATKYADAGADMILVHSKQKTPTEIESFVHAWTLDVPIVVVPTTFPDMTEERAIALKKIKMLIYGNHAIRACVAAMQKVFAKIISDGGGQLANDEIAPVSEIFRLQQMEDVMRNEKQFLR